MRTFLLFAIVMLVGIMGGRPAYACSTAACPGKPCKVFAAIRDRDDGRGQLSCIPMVGVEERDCAANACVYVGISTPVPKRVEYDVDGPTLEGLYKKCAFKKIAFALDKGDKESADSTSARAGCSASCNKWCSNVKGGVEGTLVDGSASNEFGVCQCTYLR